MIITYHDFSNLSLLRLIGIRRLAVIVSLLLGRMRHPTTTRGGGLSKATKRGYRNGLLYPVIISNIEARNFYPVE